jgi:hypothetical protein
VNFVHMNKNLKMIPIIWEKNNRLRFIHSGVIRNYLCKATFGTHGIWVNCITVVPLLWKVCLSKAAVFLN